MNKQVVTHPATRQLFSEAAQRFMKLKKQHLAAANRMWAGTLAMNFTSDELALLKDYLCPNDHGLLAKVGRKS